MPRLADRARFASDLTEWFDRSARDLPWRRSRDPYAIWVSEAMLQQTRVETVIPYFGRFMARFPTVSHLSEAALDDVLAVWSGLGYYRRARSLWLAAREVCQRFGGRLPDEVETLRTLPGVGRYTAGAVASIAYGRAVPVVDGNVTRVFCRLREIDGDPSSSVVQRRIWDDVARLVPEDRPGWFNQALMELGASLCRPKRPVCSQCPVRTHCRGHRSGRADSLPVARRRAVAQSEQLVAIVLATSEGVLMAQRSEDGRFGGLWEPPTLRVDSSRQARRALRDVGLDLRSVRLRRVSDVRHVLTHRVLEVAVYRGQPSASTLRSMRRVKALAHGEARYERLAFRTWTDAAVGASALARRVMAAGEGK